MALKKQGEDKENFDLQKIKNDKKNPIKDLLCKIKYSCQGFAYCFTHETSFIFEAFAIVAAIVCGLIFEIAPHQWVFSLLSLCLIMETEFLNTGIEAVVDLVTDKYHPLAKIAKDCGSASTFMASMVATMVHLWIYFPIFLKLILRG